MLRIDHDRLREMSVELEDISRRTERPESAMKLQTANLEIRRVIEREYRQALCDCGATSVLGGQIVDLTRDMATEEA